MDVTPKRLRRARIQWGIATGAALLLAVAGTVTGDYIWLLMLTIPLFGWFMTPPRDRRRFLGFSDKP